MTTCAVVYTLSTTLKICTSMESALTLEMHRRLNITANHGEETDEDDAASAGDDDSWLHVLLIFSNPCTNQN